MKKYTKDHEWVTIEGLEATVGITEFAAKQLGDITYVELPKKDSDVIIGDVLGVIESVKAASDVYSPVSGAVKEVNETLEEDPGLVNRSPEKDGWICRLDGIDLTELDELLTEQQYAKLLKDSSKK